MSTKQQLTEVKLSLQFINDAEPAFGSWHHAEVGFLPTFQKSILPLSS
jgi:hypothetical protein